MRRPFGGDCFESRIHADGAEELAEVLRIVSVLLVELCGDLLSNGSVTNHGVPSSALGTAKVRRQQRLSGAGGGSRTLTPPLGAADFKSSPAASADFGRPEKVLQAADFGRVRNAMRFGSFRWLMWPPSGPNEEVCGPTVHVTNRHGAAVSKPFRAVRSDEGSNPSPSALPRNRIVERFLGYSLDNDAAVTFTAAWTPWRDHASRALFPLLVGTAQAPLLLSPEE